MGVFAALDQRIATRYQIAPMDLAEPVDYVRHHLALVGRTDRHTHSTMPLSQPSSRRPLAKRWSTMTVPKRAVAELNHD